MKIIGCDLHARQQKIAMLDTDTGELEEKTLADVARRESRTGISRHLFCLALPLTDAPGLS
jgi:hypothetical protein